jgi:hypothetical protein
MRHNYELCNTREPAGSDLKSALFIQLLTKRFLPKFKSRANEYGTRIYQFDFDGLPAAPIVNEGCLMSDWVESNSEPVAWGQSQMDSRVRGGTCNSGAAILRIRHCPRSSGITSHSRCLGHIDLVVEQSRAAWAFRETSSGSFSTGPLERTPPEVGHAFAFP